MTSRERIITAMRGQVPDVVPVQLGITNMFSVLQNHFTGWDVYFYGKRPLWQIIADTQRRFGLDGYLYMSAGVKNKDNGVISERKIIRQDAEQIVARDCIHTPEGDLWSEVTFLENESPSTTTGLIKNEADFKVWLKYLLSRPVLQYDQTNIKAAKKYLGEDGVVGGTIGIPGLHELSGIFDGKLEKASYFCYDFPELAEEYRTKAEKKVLHLLEFLIDADIDYVHISASGLLTLSTPRLFKQLSLPTLKKIGSLCKNNSMLTELHCCGKSKMIVEACANETEIDCINPLQPPPMGDCDLSEIKQLFGRKICLKGNVGVTEPLLFGTPDDVEKDVIRCMNTAKKGGRYILFSEEGIGARTPVDNVIRYVEAGRYYGKY